MDPVGSWSPYASYNRLAAAGVQPTTASNSTDLHHHLATTAPSTTTAQLLPGGFLSPPPVGYENVFSPLFHPSGAKPTPAAAAHYVTQLQQHRVKQSEGEFHQQAQAFFEQGAPGAWQQNSPFGILPHESVVASTNNKTVVYDGFNAFAAAQIAKNASRAQSPAVPAKFFQADSNPSAKTFTSTSNNANLQQSCIVSSATSNAAAVVTKEYRVPRTFLTSPRPQAQAKPPPVVQVQTKAQTKIYPELNSERARNNEDQSQSSPISFSIMDAPGRLNYSGSNSSGKRPPQFQHNYQRHYNSTSEEFQRPKSSEFNAANAPPPNDCNVVVPRRPSPLQAHSQASPLGHASPAYPMYNSPMNSISSPQNNSQVAPPSPLDASVPRPNSQSGVAYPSVITRALNNSQNCWADEQRQQQVQQQRKFAATANNSQTSAAYNSGGIEASGQARTGFFDVNQMQDLSSCRGDPMSIVKNLQQQQSCHVQQQIEVKQEVKPPSKRRKSADKPAVVAPIVDPSTLHVATKLGRIPPPAHSTTANQPPQNGTAGAYFDFDRWNLPPPASKIFAAQGMHQQHQGLMVPHPHGHHAPPPLPYFAPFHLPTHPSEFSSGPVELPPIGSYEQQQHAAAHFAHHHQQQQQHQQHQHQQQHEEQPKVVVPNIEEELNFLSEDTTPKTVPKMPAKPAVAKVVDKATIAAGAGFMSSYLKFLQGERDNSPPPAVRGGRKQSWNNRMKSAQPQLLDVKLEENGCAAAPAPPIPIPKPQPPPVQQHLPPMPVAITRLSQGDPQDDPRYFPLPKERKRNSFDSSDDGFSSEEDYFNSSMTGKKGEYGKVEKEKGGRKGRPCKPGGPTEKRRLKQQERLIKQKEKQIKQLQRDRREDRLEAKSKHEIPLDIPRRESSKRAAKEKMMLQSAVRGDDDYEEPPDFHDSDSDPAWTPAAKSDDEDTILSMRKNRRGRPAGGGNKFKKSKNLIAAAAHGAGIHDIDYANDGALARKKLTMKNKHNSAPTLEDNIAASMQNNVGGNDDNPYKIGEFVVIKSELKQEWPCIWRIDGRTLLQKFEAFQQNEVTLYKNIATYTSWTPESKKLYTSVPVKCHSQSPTETIIEFLKHEMTIIDFEYQDSCMKESESYQDNFEVYIQTLISQALDSNFLMEIFQEKDEYFLMNVQTIDEITENKKQKLLSILRWPPPITAAVCTWPCFNVIGELNSQDLQSKYCAACAELGVAARVLMYGQPYNATTLEGCQPDPQAVNEKDFFMCRKCANRVELSNKVTHQKYLMYIECAKRVSEKRTADPMKDTTCILNELLADESWLNQLFVKVRTFWAEIDCIEHSMHPNCVQ